MIDESTKQDGRCIDFIGRLEIQKSSALSRRQQLPDVCFTSLGREGDYSAYVL